MIRFEWRIEEGRNLRFRKDTWCEDGCLKNMFPRIFVNSEQGEATIKNMRRLEYGR